MDVHDNLIIRHCKSSRQSYRSLRKLVGMKCAIHPKYIRPQSVIFWMSQIVDEYTPYRDLNSFIEDIDPSRDFMCGGYDECESEFHKRIIRKLASRLRHLKVGNLEDYRYSNKFAR